MLLDKRRWKAGHGERVLTGWWSGKDVGLRRILGATEVLAGGSNDGCMKEEGGACM